MPSDNRRRQITITFDVPEGVSDSQVKDVFRTAIGDYWAHRREPEAYVMKRYGTHDNAFQARQLIRIHQNVALIGTTQVGEVTEVTVDPE